MKKIIFLLVIIFSCGQILDENKGLKNDLISQEQMVNILYDMSLISVSKGVNKRVLENNGLKPMNYILDKYDIDSIQFQYSNNFYSKDLEIYLLIYEKVLEKLEINRNSIIDSIENYKKEKAKRSKEILKESQKKNILTKPNRKYSKF